MPVTRQIRDLIVRGGTSDEIAKVASDQGMKTLRESVLARVIEGLTTVDEALRVTTD
jgi:type IV pilus assembly protein PilB